jgi:hypothetical protein
MKASLARAFQSQHGLDKLLEALQCTTNPQLPNRVITGSLFVLSQFDILSSRDQQSLLLPLLLLMVVYVA